MWNNFIKFLILTKYGLNNIVSKVSFKKGEIFILVANTLNGTTLHV
jgi:hypothetical protein